MPTYTILGVSFFIPDLNDLEAAVVTPLRTFVTQTLSGITADIQAIIAPLQAAITLTLNGVVSEIRAIIAPLQTVITQALGGVAGAISVVLAPLQTFITSARDYIVNAITQAFAFLFDIPTTIRSFFYATLLPTLQGLFSPITGAIAQVVSAVAGLPSALGGVATTVERLLATFSSTVINQVTSSVTALIPPVMQNLLSIAVGDLKAFLANPLASLSVLSQTLQAALTTLGNSVTAQIANVRAELGNRVTSLEHSVSSVGEFVNSAFNQLATQLNTVLNGFGGALTGLASALWQAFNDIIVRPAQALLGQVETAISGALAQVQNQIKTAIINALPRSPQQAFDSALLVGEIGLSAVVAGELGALAIEALYPSKHWGIPEAFEKALDVTGLAAIGSALYGTIVETGWSTNLRYFFNYQLQPQRIDEGSSKLAVYYGAKSIGQYADDLRYDGFNDVAISEKVATLFQPIPVRLLITLWEDNLVSDEFIIDQVRRQGIDPANAGIILKALQFRALKPFESEARSIVFAQAKDGLLDEGTATSLLRVFGIPNTQIAYILDLARRAFAHEQKLLAKAYVLDLLKKTAISPDDARSFLESVGFDAERADILVKIAVALALPTPTKAAREALLAAFKGTTAGA